jgi:hypothetical protein
VSDTAWNISQTKFNLAVASEDEEEDPSLWWVPVTFKHVDQEAKTTFWLADRSAEVTAPASLSDNAFVFNVGRLTRKNNVFQYIFYFFVLVLYCTLVVVFSSDKMFKL